MCEPSNDHGLRIPFFHDDTAHRVVADFALSEAFSGAPSYVHGGVLLAVLDEAMGWATIAIEHTFAVTRHTSTAFRRPVRVGLPHRVEAWINGRAEGAIDAEAVITDEAGKKCALATARFIPMDAALAKDAIGQELQGADAGFVRRSKKDAT
ncbi:MAG TPA: PaaI family thioesterase [Acidimicrobiales bacterium]|nr:PaaI family thioesterase [Acidimicrobiales bacterium]